MAQRTQLDDSSHLLHEAYACLLANGLDRFRLARRPPGAHAHHHRLGAFEQGAQAANPRSHLCAPTPTFVCAWSALCWLTKMGSGWLTVLPKKST
jgi:hypothetical protein